MDLRQALMLGKFSDTLTKLIDSVADYDILKMSERKEDSLED